MDETEAILDKKPMRCNHCGNETVFYVRGTYKHEVEVEYHNFDVWYSTTWRLLQCLTCSQPTLEKVYLDSEQLPTPDEELIPEIVYPITSNTPAPASGMPKDVLEDYIEASSVLPYSPRSSAALLRLSLQRLCKHLGQSGKDLDKDIGKLVQEKGLSPKVQKALDIVRVIGNNAVHPGEIDLDDDRLTALALFDLINLIIEETITRPHQIEELYGKLPKGALEHIEKRDSKLSKSQ